MTCKTESRSVLKGWSLREEKPSRHCEMDFFTESETTRHGLGGSGALSTHWDLTSTTAFFSMSTCNISSDLQGSTAEEAMYWSVWENSVSWNVMWLHSHEMKLTCDELVGFEGEGLEVLKQSYIEQQKCCFKWRINKTYNNCPLLYTYQIRCKTLLLLHGLIILYRIVLDWKTQ